MIRACSRSRLRNPQQFTPLNLFSTGEQGAWFDPSDMATLFQDDAGAVPVTAANQAVGMIRDKSGNGHHATQATEASKPMLRTAGGLWWLEFDGVDDSLVTPNIPFTSVAMYISAAVRKTSDAALGVIMEHSTNIGGSDGTFIMLAPGVAATANYLAGFKGTIRRDRISPSTYPAPVTNVLSGNGDITAGTTRLRVDGITVSTAATGLGVGAFGNFQLYIGRRGAATLPFVGNMYGIMVIEGDTSDSEVSLNEGYLASKSGVVF